MSGKAICQVFGCESEAKSLGYCGACYSSIYYWHNKKTANDLIDRMTQLKRIEARFDYLLPTNINFPKYKRRKIANVTLPGDTVEREEKPKIKKRKTA